MAVPPQRRLQTHGSHFNKRPYVISRPRLICDACAEHTQNEPTQSGGSGSREEAADSCEDYASPNEEAHRSKTDREENLRRRSLCKPLRLAEHNAASK